MAIVQFLIQIFAAVMLLLFAVRLVRTGIERRFGHVFARYLAGRKSLAAATSSGFGLSVMLQSSAAVALLLGGFAASGMVSFANGFAALLGADLGSAIVVQFLSFDLRWLEPLLLLVGGWLYLKTDSTQLQVIGRIILGLALILVSLHLLREAVEPLRESNILPTLSNYIAADSLTGFLVGAVLAFALHSSVAAILMCVALVQTGALPFAAGLAILFGANFSSSLIAVWLTRDMPREARRIPISNMIIRGSCALAALLMIDWTGHIDSLNVVGPAQSLLLVHVGFNLLLVLVFVPLSPVLATSMMRLMPSRSRDEMDDPERPLSALDQTHENDPSVALSAIRQEILAMLEEVERMYRPIMQLYETATPEDVDAVQARDARVNDLYANLRSYMAEHARDQLSKAQLKQSRALLEYAIRVEAAGDLIAKKMTDLIRDKMESHVQFSEKGADELRHLHALVLSGFALARHVLLVDDVEAARRLVLDKAEVKRRERASRKAHLKRLETGKTDSLASSDVHLETLRALRELYGHLAAVAYPILYRSGQVLETRLAPDAPDTAPQTG